MIEICIRDPDPAIGACGNFIQLSVQFCRVKMCNLRGGQNELSCSERTADNAPLRSRPAELSGQKVLDASFDRFNQDIDLLLVQFFDTGPQNQIGDEDYSRRRRVRRVFRMLFLATCCKHLQTIKCRLIEAKHVIVLAKMPLINASTTMTLNPAHDVSLLGRPKEAVFPSDCFQGSVFWTRPPRLQRSWQVFGREPGRNLDTRGFDTVKKPSTREIDGPDSHKLEVGLRDD